MRSRAGIRFRLTPTPLRLSRRSVLRSLPQPQTQWSGGGRVLLVEDEDMVRAVAESALTRAGYTVTAASGGAERS